MSQKPFLNNQQLVHNIFIILSNVTIKNQADIGHKGTNTIKESLEKGFFELD